MKRFFCCDFFAVVFKVICVGRFRLFVFLCFNNVVVPLPWRMSFCCSDRRFLLQFPKRHGSPSRVRAWPRTKGWWISPCVSCYTQVHAQHACGCSCVLKFSPYSCGPGQTGHAETCLVPNGDIFGLLCYCETSCKKGTSCTKSTDFSFVPSLCDQSIQHQAANFLFTVYRSVQCWD